MIRLLRDPLAVARRAVNAVSAVGVSRSATEPAPDSGRGPEPLTQKEPPVVAQKTLVQLVDDLDGSEAQETISFGLDGASYEIDLSAEHATALRDALASYVGAARKTGGSASNGRRGGGRRGSRAGGGSSASTSDRERTAQIRAWAREQGLEVNDRGRIPNRVVQAYEAAH